MTTDALTHAVAAASRTDPILIAGPTASGKSALALAIAEAKGGRIINADALQVYDTWRILTARPSDRDLARAPHALYGHIGRTERYSVGHWLREAAALLADPRPIIVGGTGLYFMALTTGLAQIPPIPAAIRAEADGILADQGAKALLAAIDSDTLGRIDTQNPARVQRAWEVQRATGQSLAVWQDQTAPPLLPANSAQRMVLQAPPEILSPRIDTRFKTMVAEGALDEARANQADYDPARPSMKAIGAPELMAHLNGQMDLATACQRATIATRQYAKRQRTWFRARMADWQPIVMFQD